MPVYRLDANTMVLSEDLVGSLITKIDTANKKIEKLNKNNANIGEPLKLIEKSVRRFKLEDLDEVKDLGSTKKMLILKAVQEAEKEGSGYATFRYNSDVTRVNNFEVLGYITPVEGTEDKYTLNSYGKADIPAKYRENVNPRVCEHCNTNRKRNNAFIIRNTSTQETVQVGSACMNEYMGGDYLKIVKGIGDAIRSVEEGISRGEPGQMMYDKVLFLSYLEQIRENKNKYSGRNPQFIESIELEHALIAVSPQLWETTRLHRRSIGLMSAEETRKNIIKGYGLKKDLDIGYDLEDVLSEIDIVSPIYTDRVRNAVEVACLDTDYITAKEAAKLGLAARIGQLYTKGMLEDFYPYKDGTPYWGSKKAKIKVRDYFAAVAALQRSGKEYVRMGPDSDNSLSTSRHAMAMVSNFYKNEFLTGDASIDISEVEMNDSRKRRLALIEEVKIADEDYVAADEMIERIEKNDFEKRGRLFHHFWQRASAFRNLGKSGDDEDLIGLGWPVYSFMEDRVQMLKAKEENNLDSGQFVGTSGTRFSEMNVLFEDFRCITFTGDTGPMNATIYKFKDTYGRTFSKFDYGTANFMAGENLSESDRKKELEDLKGKYVKLSGTIKGHRHEEDIGRRVKCTTLNRVKYLGESSLAEFREGLDVKAKYVFKELKVVGRSSAAAVFIDSRGTFYVKPRSGAGGFDEPLKEHDGAKVVSGYFKTIDIDGKGIGKDGEFVEIVKCPYALLEFKEEIDGLEEVEKTDNQINKMIEKKRGLKKAKP